MKVGIVSLFDSENLGNRLQNYALQQILKEYADEVVTIKNKPKFKNWRQKLMRSSFLAESPLVNCMLGKRRKAQMLRFNNQYIQINRACYCFQKDYDSLKPKDRCDYYCAGSDQIWNPNLGRWGQFNYLGFAKYNTTFSYAASFGVDEIPEKYAESVRKGLQHIKYISVREEAGKQIVEKLTGRNDIAVLIDPTMFVSLKVWDEVASKPDGLKEGNYILTYFLGGISQKRRQEIHRKAEEMNCVIIDILDRESPYYAIGPDHFVYLVKNAKLVCTDSFHASVFAFLYQRKLVIFPRAGKNINMNSRIETLVKKFNLEDCVASDDAFPKDWESHNYTTGEFILRDEQRKAKDFLDMVFNHNAEKENV